MSPAEDQVLVFHSTFDLAGCQPGHNVTNVGQDSKTGLETTLSADGWTHRIRSQPLNELPLVSMY